MCAFASGLAFTLRVRLSTGICIIRAWDMGYDGPYHNRIDVELRQNGEVIFARGDTHCGLQKNYSVDGTHARELVLSLLAMKPGDTDGEYFASYTQDQRDWAKKNGEELSMVKDCRYCDPETGEVRRNAS